jgi:hypothetical protein
MAFPKSLSKVALIPLAPTSTTKVRGRSVPLASPFVEPLCALSVLLIFALDMGDVRSRDDLSISGMICLQFLR